MARVQGTHTLIGRWQNVNEHRLSGGHLNPREHSGSLNCNFTLSKLTSAMVTDTQKYLNKKSYVVSQVIRVDYRRPLYTQ